MIEKSATPTPPQDEAQWLETNRKFYDSLWRDARLIQPQRFNTWPLVSSLVQASMTRLEIAPGLRPRLPIAGTHFVDISEPALRALAKGEGHAFMGTITSLPVAAGSMDVVCALDIVEHVDDDVRAFAELSRITRAGGVLLLSTPLHQSKWLAFDDFVGHRRRYAPQELLDHLGRGGFVIEQSAVYGMQPRSSKLLDLGMWYLTHRRERAMWWYNRVFMPLALRFSKKLPMVRGVLDMEKADEVLLVCRRK